jgi:hypothetical protein
MSGTAAVLRVRHIATGAEVALPIFVSSFEMDAVPSWHSEEVFGRMDPIFTYKNTKRTFTAIVRTPRGEELVDDEQYQLWVSEMHAWLLGVQADIGTRTGAQACKKFYDIVWTGVLQKSFPASGEDTGTRQATSDIVAGYVPIIADLYKLMYPTWQLGASSAGTSTSSTGPFYYGRAGDRGVGRMTGTPLLEIYLSGVATEKVLDGTAPKSLIFVPETFKLTKLQSEDQPAVVINDFSDNRFAANSDGYVITLGGTILHRGTAPGFVSSAGKLYFQQGKNFPFDTGDLSQFESPRNPRRQFRPGGGSGGGSGGGTP